MYLNNSDTEKTYITEGSDMYVGSPATAGTGAFTFTETSGGSSTGTLQTALRAVSGQHGSVTATNKTLIIGT